MSDSVGSVSVDVVPDARGWSEKLRAQIRDQTVTINADADTGEAEAQLDEAARTRTAKIKTDVSQLSQGASKLDQFVGNLGLLPSLALAAGAALVPLGAALVGVTAALGAPLAIAGGGATLFGFMAAFAVKQTNEQLKSIGKLQTKLGTLTKGTQEYADTQKALKAQQDALSPAQTRFAASLDKVKGTFDSLLQGKTGQALLAPLASGLDLLAKVMPGLAPIIQAVSGALSSLLGELSDAVDGPGFQRFVKAFAHDVGPDIEFFGHIAGNAIRGVTGFILALDHSLSGGVLHGLERLSGRFANLGDNAGKSKGLRDFIDYFHKVGPQVADTLGSLARSIGHIVEALAPLGPPVLHIIQGIADAFNTIPIPVLTALAAATGGLIAFQKLGGFKVLGAAGRAAGGTHGGVVGSVLSGVQKVFVVNMPGGGLPGTGGGGVPGVPGEGAGGKGLIAKAGLLGALGQIGLLAGTFVALDAGSTAILKKEYGATVSKVGMQVIRAILPVIPDSSAIGNQIEADKRIFGGIGHALGKLHAPGNIGDLFSMPNDAVKAPPAIHLKSTTNEVDGLRASLARASRQMDQVGPRADAAFGRVVKDAHAAQAAINAIHDKRFKIIAETQSAISSLERLQALRIADKHFTVYQRNQIIEQAVGPGGGIGRHNPGGSGSGGAGAGGSGRTPVHIHLDDNGRTTLSGVIDDRYHANASADRAYDDARAGR